MIGSVLGTDWELSSVLRTVIKSVHGMGIVIGSGLGTVMGIVMQSEMDPMMVIMMA